MHYRNGREARIGDHVVGTVYNTRGVMAGTLVSATEGHDTCNCVVEFVTAVPAIDGPPAEGPRMSYAPPALRRTAEHQQSGPVAALYPCRDYSELRALLHAEDASASGEALASAVARVHDLEAEVQARIVELRDARADVHVRDLEMAARHDRIVELEALIAAPTVASITPEDAVTEGEGKALPVETVIRTDATEPEPSEEERAAAQALLHTPR